MTAEEFKDAFQRNGSLAPIMDTFAHNLRISHADWFDLANDTGECLQAIAIKAMDERRGKIGDKNVLSPLLLLEAVPRDHHLRRSWAFGRYSSEVLEADCLYGWDESYQRLRSP
jgi:hypothetical protein